MSDNENAAPATIKTGITKTKSIRISLSGDDYLDFHNISGRVIFDEKMSERASDEVLMKIGLKLLKEKIESRLKDGEQFVSANSI